jgi:DnaK suppressor protein
MSKRKVVAAPATKGNEDRYDELKRMLEDRRREILNEVQSKIKDVRSEGTASLNTGVVDAEETSVSDIQEDIELALIQMKAETLTRVNEALERLNAGSYGRCNECGDEISPQRLRALPFAVRCKDCEEARENVQQRERMMAQRRGASSLFLDVQGLSHCPGSRERSKRRLASLLFLYASVIRVYDRRHQPSAERSRG